MTGNALVKCILIDEMRWKTRLSDKDIFSIVESFMEKLEQRRYTIVPTYLTDDMYDAQKTVDPLIGFNAANALYRSAIVHWNSRSIIPDDKPEEGSFW